MSEVSGALIGGLEAIRERIRELISLRFLNTSDTPLVIALPFELLPILNNEQLSLSTKLSLVEELDGYRGAALDATSRTPIPYVYELHSLLASEKLEVLMHTRLYGEDPVAAMANEAVRRITAISSVDIDEISEVSLPVVIVDFYMSIELESQRQRFRRLVTAQLDMAGYSVVGVFSIIGLEIRRDR